MERDVAELVRLLGQSRFPGGVSVAIDEGLARVSLELVYGSLGVYSLAMVSYAVAAAQAIRPPRRPRDRRGRRAGQ